MNKKDILISTFISGTITYWSWKVIPNLEQIQIQPIASTVATLSGILFGFAMASVTLIASAKDNILVKNTQKTNYLPQLVSRLHVTMGYLLAVCVLFLISLFIPDTAVLFGNGTYPAIKYVSAIMALGVFTLCMAIYRFIMVWREFSKFASHM